MNYNTNGPCRCQYIVLVVYESEKLTLLNQLLFIVITTDRWSKK